MNRKIIIKSDDFNKDIFSFLKEVGANMPMDWNIEALEGLKDAVIGTLKKMGVTLEIDDRPKLARNWKRWKQPRRCLRQLAIP